MGDQATLQESLKALEDDVAKQMQTIVVSESGDVLRTLSASVSEDLQRLVPGGRVLLEPRQPVFRMPEFGVNLRVEEGGLETEVGRQGHGFQRALLIAVVQRLAALRPAVSATLTAKKACRAQLQAHPPCFSAWRSRSCISTRSRHVISLRHLRPSPRAFSDVQVAYVMHSEHFVDAARYERLRRFRRVTGSAWPRGEATRATIAGVTARLAGVVKPEDVAARIRMSLSRQLAEAAFARAVLILEGRTDAGFIQGIADRTGGFDVDGIAVVFGLGKSQLPMPWAILAELGSTPTYVVFDGDAGRPERMANSGKNSEEVERARAEIARVNRMLLSVFGGDVEDKPATSVQATLAVLEDNLEAEADIWSDYTAELTVCHDELGDRRGKSEDVYRLAASRAAGDPPPVFQNIILAVRSLV